MKKLIATLALTTAGLMSSNLMAAESGMYIGVKTGTMAVDSSAFDDTSAITFALGFNVNENVGFEIELGRSSAGNIDMSVYDGFSVVKVTGEYEISTAALYATFRSSDPLYVKGKIGILSEKVDFELDFDCGAPCSESEDESGLSYGVGVGYNFGAASIELGYTLIEEDVTYASLGVQLNF